MPDGTTNNAQLASNTAAPAAERQNKTPIYVSGVTDTRGFLKWLPPLCQSGLSAQIRGEKLMVVPNTAEGFRAVVSTLRSLDGSKGVSFHNFSLPKDRCVRLLVKNLGRHMTGDVVREELGDLGIRVQGVLQLRSRRRAQEADKTRPLTPHFIVSVERGPEVAKVRFLTELCGLRVSVETYIAYKRPLQCKRCQRFSHTKRYCGYAARFVSCGEAHLSGECSTPQQQVKCCSCGGNHSQLPGLR
jgi:PAX-interacting protein 1